jgi:hypothetical protein
MDPDELATPGYTILSPSTKTKLATLEKGQLMVRHPHFTQPIFVRFPRPAVMTGRDGAEQYPQATDVTIEAAVYRSLRALDPSLSYNAVVDVIGPHDEKDVLRARNLVMQERPSDVLAAFRSKLRKVVPAAPSQSQPVAALRTTPDDDPYAF